MVCHGSFDGGQKRLMNDGVRVSYKPAQCHLIQTTSCASFNTVHLLALCPPFLFKGVSSTLSTVVIRPSTRCWWLVIYQVRNALKKVCQQQVQRCIGCGCAVPSDCTLATCLRCWA